MGVIMYRNNRYAGGGSADPSLHFDWSHQTLPQTGDTNTIYCIPTGDTSDPWDFYAWNDTDEEFVKIDFNMTISIDSALSDTSTNPVQNRVVKSAIDAKADNTQTFTEASTRANIASGETFQTILGKIKKFFTDLKAVAFSGSYNDLSDKPTIPAAQVNSDWNASSGVAQILNKPTIPAEQIQSDWNQTTTTAKDYIKNKPTIPAAQVNSDWNASSGVAQILNKPTIPDTSTFMHKGVDRVTAGQSIIAPIGTASTADGFSVNASGDYSHASGFRTIASSDMQHVIGKYNEEDANGTYAFIVGGGRLDFDRKNIFTIDWNGDVNAGRSNGLTNDTKLPTGADVVSYLNSNIVMEVHTTQVLLPSPVTVNKSDAAQLLSDVDIRTLTYQTLEDISSMTKELKAVILLWSSGGGCVATDVLVSNNKLSLKVNNISLVNHTITAIRLLTFWK